mmetsp:Transcript_3355/g.5057  ORF Transcript_3355/g.5057 Transcript_3355/m.5057 type:complete len:239 (+) Transcript_3355:55-771(+)|eukprot:CAMPEP_0167746552 /NCGR_PEP_ID=MMETSP0110_2-20121227/3774_1 /TAXON_ID=629695 /ORGANISM="Gymnochlora sp., Strain CCMP2014" /LENGTH=238 /DNA_ID=CAMNT_0007631325 /DNA_START=45 /DNA_END=764 /DNA_ORIENTATION=+
MRALLGRHKRLSPFKLGVRVFSSRKQPLYEALDDLKAFEEDRVPPVDLPSYCNDFLTTREDRSRHLLLRKNIQETKEIVTVHVEMTAWDELLDPSEVELRKKRMENGDWNAEKEEYKEDRSFFFQVNVRKEGLSKYLLFDCVTFGEEFDVVRIAIADDHARAADSKLSESHTGKKNDSRPRGFDAGRLGDDIVENAAVYLLERGIDGELIHHIIDYRIRDEAKEYVQWLERVKSLAQM